MKGFFSVVIVLFVLFITLFFVAINDNSKPILFDDSPRLLALKSEEAYLIMDQNLTWDYINYKLPKLATDCNTNPNTEIFKDYLKTKYPAINPIIVNEFCSAKVRDVIIMSVPQNSFNAKISVTITCDIIKESDLNYHINKVTNVIYNKRYHAYSTGGFCRFILTDLDSLKIYVDKSIQQVNLFP